MSLYQSGNAWTNPSWLAVSGEYSPPRNDQNPNGPQMGTMWGPQMATGALPTNTNGTQMLGAEQLPATWSQNIAPILQQEVQRGALASSIAPRIFPIVPAEESEL